MLWLLVLSPILLPALFLAGFHVYLLLQGNFHIVSPGTLYRSGLLSPLLLRGYLRRYGIKSIICLQGEHPDAAWYRRELEIAKAWDVKHYAIGLSARKYLSAADFDELMTLLAVCPKPVLVHCKAGADRTGLLCAAWRLVFDGASPEEACQELAAQYGHLPRFNKTGTMKQSFWNYALWREVSGLHEANHKPSVAPHPDWRHPAKLPMEV